MKKEKLEELFTVLAQGVSRHEYQGYIIQLTVDPWARKYGSVWEVTDGERIRGFSTFAECVDRIDWHDRLGKWEVVFQWPRLNDCTYRFWYSEAMAFGKLFGKEVSEDWVNRKILVK
jgi:hypothetical protein